MVDYIIICSIFHYTPLENTTNTCQKLELFGERCNGGTYSIVLLPPGGATGPLSSIEASS